MMCEECPHEELCLDVDIKCLVIAGYFKIIKDEGIEF